MNDQSVTDQQIEEAEILNTYLLQCHTLGY
jgi:hypothetical protein